MKTENTKPSDKAKSKKQIVVELKSWIAPSDDTGESNKSAKDPSPNNSSSVPSLPAQATGGLPFLNMHSLGSHSTSQVKYEVLPSLQKPFLRFSSQLTIRLLKKFLAFKLKRDAEQLDIVSINGEILGLDHSIEFIRKTRWHEQGHITLAYRSRVRVEENSKEAT